MSPAFAEDWINEDGQDRLEGESSCDAVSFTIGHGIDSLEGIADIDHIILSGITGQTSDFLIEDAATFNRRTQSAATPSTVMISADGALLMNAGAADRITIDAGSTDETLTIAGDFSSTSLANGNVTFNSCGGTVPDLDHMTSDLNVRVTRGGLDDDAITPDSTVSNAIPPDAGPPIRPGLRTPVTILDRTRKPLPDRAKPDVQSEMTSY